MTKQAPYKIGIVGIPGKWSTEVLADEVEALTGFRLVIDIEQVVTDLTSPSVRFQEHCLCDLDAIIIKKISQTYSPAVIDRLEVLQFLESCGVRIFSKPHEIIHLVNRLSCTVALASAKIPMPPTLITEDIDAAFEGVQTYGEAILKPLFSTKARGMELLSAATPAKRLKNQLKDFYQKQGIFYLQKKLALPGKDLGLMFLNNQYQGAYARVGNGHSWNTTIHSGGKYEKATPSDEIIEMAYKAQSVFNLSYTTVDIAETEQGPVCFEVSAFGGFKGAHEGLNINMAARYAQYVVAQLNQNDLTLWSQLTP